MTLTIDMLQNAELDCDTLSHVVNGAAADPDVLTRFGVNVPTLAKMIASIVAEEETATAAAALAQTYRDEAADQEVLAEAQVALALNWANLSLFYRNQAVAAQNSALASLAGANTAEALAATYAAAAGVDAGNAAATRDAIQALIDGYPGAAGQTIPVATRAAAKAIANPVGSFYLYETNREGDLVVVDYATISAALGADPNEGVWFRSAATPAKAFLRIPAGKRITPYHFGALGGYTTVAACLGGAAVDDYAAIAALLTFWVNNPSYIPDFLGRYWTTSAEVRIVQTVGNSIEQNPLSLRAGNFVTLPGSVGTRIVTLSFPGGNIVGQIGAIGNGAADGNCINYANRGWDYGVYLVDSHQIRMPHGWFAANVKCWGFDAATEDMAHLGNRADVNGSNIGVRVGPGNFFNVGSAAGQANSSCLTYQFDSITYNGSSGSVNQTCTCHATTPIDPKIVSGDNFTFSETAAYVGCGTTINSKTVTVPSTVGMVRGQPITGAGIPAATAINSVDSLTQITITANATATNAAVTLTVTTARTSYEISSIDLVANTVTFYFWLPLGTYAGTVAVNWSMDSAHGGALHIHGGNSGESTYGGIEGIRCGVGLKDSGLYGSYVASVHTEASGINECRGGAPNATTRGGATMGKHCESTYLNTVHRGTTPTRRLGLPTSGYGFAPATEFQNDYHSRPRLNTGVLAQIGSTGIIQFGEQCLLQNEGGPASYSAPGAAFTISNRPWERYYPAVFPVAGQNSLTCTLDWYPEFADQWTGKNWMGFECSGAGSRGGLTQITVQLTTALINNGYKLNGGTSALVYTALRGPCRGRAIYDYANKNFVFSLVEFEPISLKGVTYQGDAAVTLSVGTSTKTQIFNVPLTAARTVTLSTTSAKQGDRFRVMRSAACTGLFNLTVGSSLKVLTAPGQWCEVEFDGTAWQLVADGPRDGVAFVGNASVTLTAGTSARNQLFNTPLTANRTITLSATALMGDRFRITRTAAATGAFNLDVGGLKTLTAAGQWAVVIFDGAAWQLQMDGTL